MKPIAPALVRIPSDGLKILKEGKVRTVFDLGSDRLLITASDRISAFDVILPTGIPEKGRILTRISEFWFRLTGGIIENHLLTTDLRDPSVPAGIDPALNGRSMLVRRTRPLEVECIVRGYLAGSGWKEYQRCGKICGIGLPAGLRESDRLPEPVFTPTTKAPMGQHDENIDFDAVVQMLGRPLAEQVRNVSLQLFKTASEHALARGILIADTKFEFGMIGDRLVLIDEIFTPDSSRFWSKADYQPGRSQDSFDKQFVRDYLETLSWNKTAPGPELPEEIVTRTRDKYIQAYKSLTGKKWA